MISFPSSNSRMTMLLPLEYLSKVSKILDPEKSIQCFLSSVLGLRDPGLYLGGRKVKKSCPLFLKIQDTVRLNTLQGGDISP